MKFHIDVEFYENKKYLEKADLWKMHISEEQNIDSVFKHSLLNDHSPHVNSDHIITHLKTDGVFILDYRFTCKKDAVLNVKAEGGFIIMEFSLNIQEVEIDILCKRGQLIKRHNLYYINNYSQKYFLYQDLPLDCFCIFMTKTFYFNMVEKTNSLHDTFAQKIHDGLNNKFTEFYLPVNFEMENIISKIRNCSRTGRLHRFCLEIKIKELLLLQFEQYYNMILEISPKQFLQENDIIKIKTAKTILDQRYSRPPTIRQLSRIVGVNEYKLKKGFKEFFQITIHEYVTKCRMEKANQMIQEQKLQVKEVATELGYKNPSHFSAAFKKYFGFLPSEMVS